MSYDQKKFGSHNFPPHDWEVAAQTATKSMVVMSNPGLHDPDGSKQKHWISMIEKFDIDTGQFKNDEVNLQTPH